MFRKLTMKKIFPLLLILILFSCKKKNTNTGCGNPKLPQGTWTIKYEVMGTYSPDSIIYSVNTPANYPNRNFYQKKVALPQTPASDSITYCGNTDDDIYINVYDSDTSHHYTLKIYVDNVLKTTNPGQYYLYPNFAGTQPK